MLHNIVDEQFWFENVHGLFRPLSSSPLPISFCSPPLPFRARLLGGCSTKGIHIVATLWLRSWWRFVCRTSLSRAQIEASRSGRVHERSANWIRHSFRVKKLCRRFLTYREAWLICSWFAQWIRARHCRLDNCFLATKFHRLTRPITRTFGGTHSFTHRLLPAPDERISHFTGTSYRESQIAILNLKIVLFIDFAFRNRTAVPKSLKLFIWKTPTIFENFRV